MRVGQYRPEERLALFFAVDDQPTTEADGLDHRLLQTRKHRIDVIGAVIMMGAAIALLLALSWGGRDYPWFSAPIVALLAVSLALWAVFAWHLTRAEEPFLPLNVLGNKIVRTAAMTGACTMGTRVGMTKHTTFLFSAGSSLRRNFDPKFIMYAGVQVTF